MKCRQFEGSLTEFARGSPLDTEERAGLVAHLEKCGTCKTTLGGQVRLSAAASVLAGEAARFHAPFSVEQALQAELRAAGMAGDKIARPTYVVVGLAIAASLTMAWVMLPRSAAKPAVTDKAPVTQVAVAAVSPVVPQPAMQVIRKRHRRATPPAAQPEQPFIAIPYTLPLEPYERAEVMRMDIPVSALIAAGLPTNMMDPEQRRAPMYWWGRMAARGRFG